MEQEDKIEAFQFYFKMMKFFWLFPKHGDSFSFVGKIKFFFFAVISTTVLMCCTFHLFRNKIRNTITLHDAVEDITIMFTEFGFLVIICFWVYNHKKIKNFVDALLDFSKYKKPEGLDPLTKKINILTLGWGGFGTSCAIMYQLLKVLFDKSCYENNIKYNLDDLCGTVAPTWLPFKLNPPYDRLFVLYQFLTVLPLTGMSSYMVAFAFGCSEFIIVRIHHLNEMLEEVFKDDDYESCKRRLNFCVEYHIHIIWLEEQFNDCFEKYFLAYFTQNAPIISMIGFTVMVKRSIPSFILMVGWIMQLSITCLSGQRLIDESLSVAFAAFDCNWYDVDVSLQLTIQLLIMRAQKPLTQRAWKFTISSFMTLNEILKTSYSILAVLNTSYNY